MKPPMSPLPNPQEGRTIIIGDIHGCFAELETLLKTVEATPLDHIVCVGDLVRKGPESAAVLRWAMTTPNVRCVLGNHEARLLTDWFAGEKPDRQSADAKMIRELGAGYNDAMDFIRSWPIALEVEDLLVVHAGLDPRIPALVDQSAHDLMTIRVPKGMKDPWYEKYDGDRTVVFGHWAGTAPVVRKNAIGLDTGCVYGNALSALILPERRIVSVPALRAHVGKDLS